MVLTLQTSRSCNTVSQHFELKNTWNVILPWSWVRQRPAGSQHLHTLGVPDITSSSQCEYEPGASGCGPGFPLVRSSGTRFFCLYWQYTIQPLFSEGTGTHSQWKSWAAELLQLWEFSFLLKEIKFELRFPSKINRCIKSVTDVVRNQRIMQHMLRVGRKGL